MFAKIFSSIYDGTLADHWQALVTFQQLLILSDAQGVVDMTPGAIARKTGIPREIIDTGLAFLAEPDPQSRSTEMEGRRIALIDDARKWGWFIVNHAEYRKKISAEEKRERDRVRIAARRANEEPEATGSDTARQSATCRAVSLEVANVAHTDTEEDTEEAEAKARAAQEFTQEPNSEASTESPAVRACKLVIGAGVSPSRVNPSHAKLHEALHIGVTPQMIADAVPGALAAQAQNPFIWAVTVAMSEFRKRGADPPPAAHTARPNAITQNFEGVTY